MNDDRSHMSKSRLGDPVGFSWPVAIVGIVAIAVVCALTLVLLDNVGRSARRPVDGTVVGQLISASTGAEAMYRLEQTGLRAAYIIQMGTNAAYEPLDFSAAISTESIRPDSVYPLRVVDAQRFYVENLNSQTYMIVAARTGLARKIDHVVPPALYEEIRQSASEGSDSDITVMRDHVRINLEGEVRRVLSAMPKTNERFVLLVNASYFAQATPEEVAEILRPYSAHMTYIVVSEDQDDPTIGAATRDRAKQFIALLTEASR